MIDRGLWNKDIVRQSMTTPIITNMFVINRIYSNHYLSIELEWGRVFMALYKKKDIIIL